MNILDEINSKFNDKLKKINSKKKKDELMLISLT
jgi:hypothetical protein